MTYWGVSMDRGLKLALAVDERGYINFVDSETGRVLSNVVDFDIEEEAGGGVTAKIKLFVSDMKGNKISSRCGKATYGTH